MLKHKIKPYTFIYIALLHLSTVLAQVSDSPFGPFSYSAPHGDAIYIHSLLDDNNNYEIRMNNTTSFTSGTDGFVVHCFYKNLSNYDRLLNFKNSNGQLIEIIYQDKTLKIKRENQDKEASYDYILFDPLFISNETDPTWEMKFFFTANLFWVEVNTFQSPPVESRYISLTYFGMDYNFTQDTLGVNMQTFINKEETSIITLGGPHNSSAFEMPSYVKLYPFNFNNFLQHVQSNFSDPAPTSNVKLSSLEPDEPINLTESDMAQVDQNMLISPVPVIDKFTIQLYTDQDKHVTISIYDIQQKCLYQTDKTLFKGNNSIPLSLQSFGINTENQLLIVEVKGNHIHKTAKLITK